MFARSSNYPRCRGRCLFPANSQRFTRGWEKGNKYIMHTKTQRVANQTCSTAKGARPGNMEMSRVMCEPDEQMYESVRACVSV